MEVRVIEACSAANLGTASNFNPPGADNLGMTNPNVVADDQLGTP
jgi:hypothetical protein